VTPSPSTTQREAGSLRPARRRLSRRLSASHVVIAIVVILAFVLNLLVLHDRDATSLVAVAAEPIAAGSELDPATLRLVPVDSGFEALPGLVTGADLAHLEGWMTARPIPEGGLIERSAMVEPGSASGLRTMSLPVPVEHAAGGSVVPGDRVDVIAVIDGTAQYVAGDLEVVSVAAGSSGGIGSIAAYHVVVSVDAAEALALAQAMDSGSIEIVRSTGAEPIEARSGDGS
jgi:Flp pilus assembly protein CpaB